MPEIKSPTGSFAYVDDDLAEKLVRFGWSITGVPSPKVTKPRAPRAKKAAAGTPEAVATIADVEDEDGGSDS